MSNQTSLVEPKNNIMDRCFSPSHELEDEIIKNISQDTSDEDQDQEQDKALPKNLSRTQSQESEALSETDSLSEMDKLARIKDQLAREAYRMARDCGTYDYYRFSRDFPDDDQDYEDYDEQQVKCPTCEEMIYVDNKHGMCYTCFDIEQKLYPDDIPMELRYNN